MVFAYHIQTKVFAYTSKERKEIVHSSSIVRLCFCAGKLTDNLMDEFLNGWIKEEFVLQLWIFRQAELADNQANRLLVRGLILEVLYGFKLD